MSLVSRKLFRLGLYSYCKENPVSCFRDCIRPDNGREIRLKDMGKKNGTLKVGTFGRKLRRFLLSKRNGVLKTCSKGDGDYGLRGKVR